MSKLILLVLSFFIGLVEPDSLFPFVVISNGHQVNLPVFPATPPSWLLQIQQPGQQSTNVLRSTSKPDNWDDVTSTTEQSKIELIEDVDDGKSNSNETETDLMKSADEFFLTKKEIRKKRKDLAKKMVNLEDKLDHKEDDNKRLWKNGQDNERNKHQSEERDGKIKSWNKKKDKHGKKGDKLNKNVKKKEKEKKKLGNESHNMNKKNGGKHKSDAFKDHGKQAQGWKKVFHHESWGQKKKFRDKEDKKKWKHDSKKWKKLLDEQKEKQSSKEKGGPLTKMDTYGMAEKDSDWAIMDKDDEDYGPMKIKMDDSFSKSDDFSPMKSKMDDGFSKHDEYSPIKSKMDDSFSKHEEDGYEKKDKFVEKMNSKFENLESYDKDDHGKEDDKYDDKAYEKADEKHGDEDDKYETKKLVMKKRHFVPVKTEPKVERSPQMFMPFDELMSF
ncbi:hypothetical protein HDE_14529 [Halotydeus destructor]|nr:hypothetical protein HDE_14529 [Halotydeus destructor]